MHTPPAVTVRHDKTLIYIFAPSPSLCPDPAARCGRAARRFRRAGCASASGLTRASASTPAAGAAGLRATR